MAGMTERQALIEARLREALAPVHLVVEDESHLHRGHAGAREGGHFRATIASAAFEGKTLVEQHRLVHDALRGLFGTEIHALALKTVPASRWAPPP
jgi:BolA protein